MADNDQNNDEYKFTELDSLDNDHMGDSDSGLNSSMRSGKDSYSGKKDIKRNALIAIGLIVFALVMYKFIGSMWTKKVEPAKPVIAPITQVTPQPIQPVETTPIPVIEQPQPIVVQADTDLKQKVAAIEISQQSVRTEVSSLGDQVGNVTNNVSNLNAQITKLNQLIGDLSNQLSKQSDEINMLRVRAQPKPTQHIVRQPIQRIFYYIQAVIPGRAWIIGSNGSTLTVREGTKIAGYGIVKLIDSVQGRVLTSSGQVIRFSQEDS